MFPALVLAAITGPQCWDIFDGALQHNAVGLHPAYVSYDERISVTQDKLPVIDSLAHVDYRDDGTARVEDERFNYEPIYTNHAEPGPPELGPYGSARAAWFPFDVNDPSLRVISSVHVNGNLTCRLDGIVNYKDHRAYHLVFGNYSPDRPVIKEIWIDAASQDVWKLIVSGYVYFADPVGPQPLADFQVELGYAGPFLVVNHVVWQLRHHEFSQYANYFGEYILTGFNFPNSLPPAYFGDSTKR
ncbi:MAG TPA: hypothetical protein VGR69_04200 [Candidatus Rubrimentiphilum sp.]|nr:hypothetical protein [Candidatus Rubrimentiphilum sp.]